jgi:periplasmic protein TonB
MPASMSIHHTVPTMSSALRHAPAGPQPTALAGPAPALHPRRHPAGLIAIAGAHLALVWLLLQGDVVQRAVHQVSPLMVALLRDPAPPPALPALPALPRPTLPTPLRLPPPTVLVADAPPAPVPAVVALATPAPPSAQPVAPASPAPVAAAQVPSSAPAPLPAPAAATPTLLAASAIRYRVPPATVVPMASRRLGEAGTVLLRVWVDAQGLPRQVRLHRSSGFSRLDEQALAAMRQARFEPVTDGGGAIEWVVIAPLQYEID